jgi:hypothetical protein
MPGPFATGRCINRSCDNPSGGPELLHKRITASLSEEETGIPPSRAIIFRSRQAGRNLAQSGVPEALHNRMPKCVRLHSELRKIVQRERRNGMNASRRNCARPHDVKG